MKFVTEWFLDSSASAHFTPFKSDFVSMTQGNYGPVETANSKAPLFMVVVGTVLIEHEIIDLKDRTTRIAISKLWPVYCVPGMTMHVRGPLTHDPGVPSHYLPT